MHVGQHVIEAGNAEIGHAQGPGSDSAAGEVNRAVTGFLGEDRVIGANRTRHLQRLLGGQRRAKLRAGGGKAHARDQPRSDATPARSSSSSLSVASIFSREKASM